MHNTIKHVERERDRERERERARERERERETTYKHTPNDNDHMTMEAHKLFSKLYSLISKFTVSEALCYIFSHSVHFLTNVSNDDASFILVGRLFQTTTPEYEKLPLFKLHFASGNKYVLCATDLKLDAVLSRLIYLI